MSDDEKRKGLIQCRNHLLDELIKHIRNSSNVSNDELYKYIIGIIKQIDFINDTLDSSNSKDDLIQKRLDRRKIFSGIYK